MDVLFLGLFYQKSHIYTEQALVPKKAAKATELSP